MEKNTNFVPVHEAFMHVSGFDNVNEERGFGSATNFVRMCRSDLWITFHLFYGKESVQA